MIDRGINIRFLAWAVNMHSVAIIVSGVELGATGAMSSQNPAHGHSISEMLGLDFGTYGEGAVFYRHEPYCVIKSSNRTNPESGEMDYLLNEVALRLDRISSTLDVLGIEH